MTGRLSGAGGRWQNFHGKPGLRLTPFIQNDGPASKLALRRALRRMAGLVFLLVFWVLAGACQKYGVGGMLLCNVQFTIIIIIMAPLLSSENPSPRALRRVGRFPQGQCERRNLRRSRKLNGSKPAREPALGMCV